MNVFNAFYYSFSPAVASVVSSSPAVKALVRALLYPLILVLRASSFMFDALAWLPELGIIVTGIVTSALISLVYVALPAMGITYITKRRRRGTGSPVLLAGKDE